MIPKFSRSSARQKKSGQAFVEFALIMPVYMLFLLCFIQIVLIMHAKFMLDYAAFCAVRAGVVNKGNMNDMKMAAAEVMAPVMYAISNPDPASRSTEDTLARWWEYSTLISTTQISEGGGTPLKLSILNEPSPVSKWNEEGTKSTFQLTQGEKKLELKLDYDFEMKIPLANYIISDLKAGILGDESTLSTKFYRAEDSAGLSNPSIRLSSTCSMRLSTLSTPG